MTELNLFEEFAICSIDELRDEEIRMAETTSFCLSEKKHLSWICHVHVVRQCHTNVFTVQYAVCGSKTAPAVVAEVHGGDGGALICVAASCKSHYVVRPS